MLRLLTEIDRCSPNDDPRTRTSRLIAGQDLGTVTCSLFAIFEATRMSGTTISKDATSLLKVRSFASRDFLLAGPDVRQLWAAVVRLSLDRVARILGRARSLQRGRHVP